MVFDRLRGGGRHPGLRMEAGGSEPKEGQCGRLIQASLAGVATSCGEDWKALP